MVTTWMYNLRNQNEPYKRTLRHHKETLGLPNNGSPHFFFPSTNAHSLLSFSKLLALSLLKPKPAHTLLLFFFAHPKMPKSSTLFLTPIQPFSFISMAIYSHDLECMAVVHDW